MEKNLYNLELHEQLIIDKGENEGGGYTKIVMRVPGGWIYRSYTMKENATESTVFVPYSDEFNPTKGKSRVVHAHIIK